MSITISPQQRNLAIAEIVLFSLIQLIQFITRYLQEWKYWHHARRKSRSRCIFYSWFGLIGLLAQGWCGTIPNSHTPSNHSTLTVRIAGAAVVLSDPHPNKSKLIAEISLQSIGLSPLLFEMSLVLLRRYPSPALNTCKTTSNKVVAKPVDGGPETRDIPRLPASRCISSASPYSSVSYSSSLRLARACAHVPSPGQSCWCSPLRLRYV